MNKRYFVPIWFDLIDNKDFMSLSRAQLKILLLLRRYVWRELKPQRNGLNGYFAKGQLATCLSVPKIATKTNMTDKWARTSLRHLEERKLVITIPIDGKSSIYILGTHNGKKGLDYKELYYYEGIFDTAGKNNASGVGRNKSSLLGRNNSSAKNIEEDNREPFNKERRVFLPGTAKTSNAEKSEGFSSKVFRENTGAEQNFRPFNTVLCGGNDPTEKIKLFFERRHGGNLLLYNKAATKPNPKLINQLFKTWEEYANKYNQRDGVQKVKLVPKDSPITESNLTTLLKMLGYYHAKQLMKWVFEKKFSDRYSIKNATKNPNLGFISKKLMMDYGVKKLGWLKGGGITGNIFYQDSNLYNAWDKKIHELEMRDYIERRG